MSKDEEYEEFADPKLYSYFEEVLKRPTVKNWLGWKDEAKKFTNAEHLQEFYGWMVGEADEEGGRSDPKLPEAKSVRELATVLEDIAAMSAFRAADGTLSKALARYQAEHPTDWLPTVLNAEVILAALSADVLRNIKDDEAQALTKLGERIGRVLRDRKKLKGK